MFICPLVPCLASSLSWKFEFTVSQTASAQPWLYKDFLLSSIILCVCAWLVTLQSWHLFFNILGPHCYGCTNCGHADMKHPDSSVEYIAGHLDVCLPCCGSAKWSDSDGDDVKCVWLFISLGSFSASLILVASVPITCVPLPLLLQVKLGKLC